MLLNLNKRHVKVYLRILEIYVLTLIARACITSQVKNAVTILLLHNVSCVN